MIAWNQVLRDTIALRDGTMTEVFANDGKIARHHTS